MPEQLNLNRKRTKENSQKSVKMCTEGRGWGRRSIDSHPIKYQGHYDDWNRGLRGVSLSYEESKAAYTCRKCGALQGCASCIDDVASLVCRDCHDWANNLSQQVHGRMVGPELAEEGMKLILMVSKGQITVEDFNKLWDEARAKA